jgi:hypothetical protein
MITLEDCIAMCGLSEEEVLAVAEHEHIPEMAAAALAQYLLGQAHGTEKIRDMLRDDIGAALARGDRQHARELFMALRHFLSTHPEAASPRCDLKGDRASMKAFDDSESNEARPVDSTHGRGRLRDGGS